MPIILGPGPSLTATTTALGLIERAYRILGDLGSGENLTSDQSTTGLLALNSMLDSFSIERLMVYQIAQEALSWPANTASRTIGPGGEFDTDRPNEIEIGTFFEDSNAISYAVDIARDRSTYDRIPDKTIKSSYPELIFYDPAHTVGILKVYPIPNQALTLYLNTWVHLQSFGSLTEPLILPPGYKLMLEYNLAKHLEAEAGLPLPAAAREIARESKATVKRHNNPTTFAQTETSYVLHGRGRSDIVAGK